MIVAAAAAVLAAGVAFAAPAAAVPSTALTVSPAHVSLEPGGRAALHIGAGTGRRLRLRASVAGLALDGRGKPHIAARGDAAPWLSVSPQTVEVTHAGTTVVIAARLQASARPGDHSALVLLTAIAPANKGVAVLLRVGIAVTVRVQGKRVHRVEVIRARARRTRAPGTAIEVTFANRGNVIESIGGARLRITLLHRGRVIARLPVAQRKVLPRTSALVVLHYRGSRRGAATLRIALAGPGGKTVTRSFPLRL
jgi:hypothetical protein